MGKDTETPLMLMVGGCPIQEKYRAFLQNGGSDKEIVRGRSQTRSSLEIPRIGGERREYSGKSHPRSSNRLKSLHTRSERVERGDKNVDTEGGRG